MYKQNRVTIIPDSRNSTQIDIVIALLVIALLVIAVILVIVGYNSYTQDQEFAQQQDQQHAQQQAQLQAQIQAEKQADIKWQNDMNNGNQKIQDDLQKSLNIIQGNMYQKLNQIDKQEEAFFDSLPQPDLSHNDYVYHSSQFYVGGKINE